MIDPNEIDHQYKLLKENRDTLYIYVKQQAGLGTLYIPPGIAKGINEARAEIRRIKGILRGWGKEVADYPDDEELLQIADPLQPGAATETQQIGSIAPVPFKLDIQSGKHRAVAGGAYALPSAIPAHFQGRSAETSRIEHFLADEVLRILMVIGRSGIGKTAVVRRTFKLLQQGDLPGNGASAGLPDTVYLNASGPQPITIGAIYAALRQRIPQDTVGKLDQLFRKQATTTTDKIYALLRTFDDRCTALILDNFEQALHPTTEQIADPDLEEALLALLNCPDQHRVKVILVSCIVPTKLALARDGLGKKDILRIRGLPPSDAENCLLQMDGEGRMRALGTSDELLKKACERLMGIPRALEALYMFLSTDMNASLSGILDDHKGALPDDVMNVLIGDAFKHLDDESRKVMQALATYDWPVEAQAVDHLLKPYLPNVSGEQVLKRLVNKYFVRHHQEARTYSLSQADRTYVFEQIERGQLSDRDVIEHPPFSRFALLHRAANFLKSTWKLPMEWSEIGQIDVAPRLAEFELRYLGEEYETAAKVLLDIQPILLLRGDHQTLADRYNRLRDTVRNPSLKLHILVGIGNAHLKMGRYQLAIDTYQQALAIARDTGHQSGERQVLSNLGSCYIELGQISRACEYAQHALELTRDLARQAQGDFERFDLQVSEAWCLVSLGVCSVKLGQPDQAIQHYQRALDFAREIDNEGLEEACLTNLGNAYSMLDQLADAIAYYRQALAIQKDDRYGAGTTLHSLAEVLIDQGDYQEAIRQASEGVKIGEELSSRRLRSENYSILARAYLLTGDLVAARTAAENARQYDFPEHNHYVLALLGIIAIRLDDLKIAREVLTEALTQATQLLDQNPQILKARDTQWLALCGLALCGQRKRIPAAIQSYREAQTINAGAGTARRRLCLFEALVQADSEGVLAEVRAVSVAPPLR